MFFTQTVVDMLELVISHNQLKFSNRLFKKRLHDLQYTANDFYF